jgi:hypothetical protein
MLGLVLHLIKIMPVNDGMYYSIAPLAAMGIAAGIQALTGVIQGSMAGDKKEEPVYTMSEEAKKALALGEQMSKQGMPGVQQKAALDAIRRSSVQAMRTASMAGSRGLLGSIGNIQAQENLSVIDLAVRDASMMQQNQRFYYTALMAGAQAKDKEFANIWQSWANKEQQRRANEGAMIQNLGQAAQTLIAGTQYANAGTNTTTTDDILGPQISPMTDRIAISGALMRAGRTTNMQPQQLPSNMTNTGGNYLWGNP